MFCNAYKIGFYGKTLQWVIVGVEKDDWWIPADDIDCTREEMMMAVTGTMQLEMLPVSSSNQNTVASKVRTLKFKTPIVHCIRMW